MKLSYAITVCNEFVEIQRLISQLLQHKRVQDEIVVLVDLTKNDPTSELLSYLHKQSSNNTIELVEDNFNNHFADWKNKLTSHCKGDYIINIDADEYLHPLCIENLPSILETNPTIDVFLVPRVNTVEGMTSEHAQKWGWYVNQDGWINFPDYQWRIYKNTPTIKWINKVHERLDGFKQYTYLPQDEEYSLYHPKTIQKQEQQNNFYNTL